MGLDNKNIHGADVVLEKLQAVKRYLQTKVFTVVGAEAVNTFKNNFQQEGFVDNTVTKWATRKTKRMGSTDVQKTLSKSGELADSLAFEIKGNTVIIYSDKVYAQIHNEGGRIEVTAKMKRYFWAMHYQAKQVGNAAAADQYKSLALAKEVVMPQRKFIGNSEQLNQNIIEKIKRDLTKILS